VDAEWHQTGIEAATLILPALVQSELTELAHALAGQEGVSAESTICGQLQAMAGRCMTPGGWTEAERHAAGEQLVTGRSRPYCESTLRKIARAVGGNGGVEAIMRTVEGQVEAAARAYVAIDVFTDMYDQVYYTKKLAHSGPVGGLGNRILACTYFGVTFVRLGNLGPELGYHLSWHKPASPLADGLQELYEDAHRHQWLTEHARLHCWDRGGNGRPVLEWAYSHGIPYLTMTDRKLKLSDYSSPTYHTGDGLAVFVRSDDSLAIAGDGTSEEQGPRQIIFPAHPAKGALCDDAIDYRINADLSKTQILNLNVTYKGRWAGNEHPIKNLIAVGFNRNLERSYTVTTSRGQDGQLEPLSGSGAQVQEGLHILNTQEEQGSHPVAEKPDKKRDKLCKALEDLKKELVSLSDTGEGRDCTRARLQAKLEWAEEKLDAHDQRKREKHKKRLLKQQEQVLKKQAELSAQPQIKGARISKGGELFCKYLMLLIYNAIALLLAKSPLHAIREMTPALLYSLLLGRPTLVSIEYGTTYTLWIQPLNTTKERAYPQELVRLINEAKLVVRGQTLRVKIHKSSAIFPPMRESG
jgi:hypothetical protein